MQTRCRRAGHITLNTFRETRDYHSVVHLMQCPSNPKDACPFCDKADRKSTRLNSSHQIISYAVFCLKKKKTHKDFQRRPPLTETRFQHRPSPAATERGTHAS